MKQFLKTLAASFAGVVLALALWSLLTLSVIGTLFSSFADKSAAVIPSSVILQIDLSEGISEQDEENAFDFSDIMGEGVRTNSERIGIYNAVSAIDYAAKDPAVKFIYISNCSFHADVAHLEEIRDALVRFHNSGKAIVAYDENLSLGGWYVASVADKQYLHPMTVNEAVGVSATLFFLKDGLSRLGVNVQLVRHGRYKSGGEMFSESTLSKENREQNQEMVSTLWKILSGAISESRELPEGKLDMLVNNLELGSADELLSHGLIDGVVSRQEMTEHLCDLFGVSDSRDLKFVSLSRYAKARIRPDLRASDKVAVIYADGDINSGDGEDGIMSDRFRKIINDVRQDKAVKAVVLRVNSPGGSALGAEEIREELEMLKKEKPLIASFGNYAASGGYWISAGADKIFTDRSTITGSIGVFGLIPDFSRLAKEKLHINIFPINSNDHSDMYSLMRPLTSDEIKYMERNIEDIYSRFVNIVASGRGMNVEEVEEIGQGRVWTGDDAMRIRLADETGGLTDAISYAAVVAGLDNFRVEEHPAVRTQLEKIAASFEKNDETMASVRIWWKRIRDAHGCFARMPYQYHFE